MNEEMGRGIKGLLLLILIFGGVSIMFWSAFAGTQSVDSCIIVNERLWLFIPATLVFIGGLVLKNKWVHLEKEYNANNK